MMFEKKFNILKNFPLLEFMNSLNNFKFEHIDINSKINRQLKFNNFLINKIDWLRFIDYKIINSPLMPALDINYKQILINYLDDVFDILLQSYNYFTDTNSDVIPKAVIVAFIFNSCNSKISQKINIFINLFVNSENYIELETNIYIFLYSLMNFAFSFPTGFIVKMGTEENLKNYFGIKSSKDYEKYENREVREKYLIESFNKELKIIFGEENNYKKYTREDFKLFLCNFTSNGGIWLLNNDLIRERIEKYLK